MANTIKIYVIRCISHGQYDDDEKYEGIFHTVDAANNRASELSKEHIKSTYEVKPFDAEPIIGNRLIVNNRILPNEYSGQIDL